MAALPYALSVHHFISRVGDYVGFAAIIAVAIMVLLLFAHARETAELRRRAEYAEDELSVLHERVEWLRGAQRTAGVPQAGTPGVTAAPAAAGGDGGPAPVPPPAAAGARGGYGARSGVTGDAATLATGAGVASASGAGGGGDVAPVPAPASAARRAVVLGAPLGVGAPALSSATKLIPPTDQELRAVAAGAGASPGATPEPALLAAGSAGRGDRGAAVVAPPAPPPATAAAGGNGAPSRRTGIAADPGAPRAAGRPGQPGGATSPRRNYGAGSERPGRRRTRRTLIAVLTLLVAAIVVVAVLVLGSSNKSHTTAAVSTPSASAKHTAKGSAKKGKAGSVTVNINPATVTVAVLNGTTTPNLAAAVSGKLSAKGFQQGMTANAADQSMPTTVVGYVPSASGAKNDAYAVANTLGLKQTAVKPVSAANQTVACMSDPTSCPDQVIVTVGADLNSDAT